MADSERATSISYKWSIVTFCVSNTVFEIIRCLVYNEISQSRPKFWGFFGPHNPKFQTLQTGPLKGTSLRQNTHFELLCVRIRQSVRPVRVLMKQKKKTKKKKNRKLFGRQCHPSRRVPSPCWILTKFGTLTHPWNVIMCAKFRVNPFMRFGSVRGQIFHFPL